MARISKRTVDAARPVPRGRFSSWDETLPGFGLLVLPTGTRSFIFQYRSPGGRSRRATIAKVGTLTLYQAAPSLRTWRGRSGLAATRLSDRRAAPRGAHLLSDTLDRYLASPGFASKPRARKRPAAVRSNGT